MKLSSRQLVPRTLQFPLRRQVVLILGVQKLNDFDVKAKKGSSLSDLLDGNKKV